MICGERQNKCRHGIRDFSSFIYTQTYNLRESLIRLVSVMFIDVLNHVGVIHASHLRLHLHLDTLLFRTKMNFILNLTSECYFFFKKKRRAGDTGRVGTAEVTEMNSSIRVGFK